MFLTWVIVKNIKQICRHDDDLRDGDATELGTGQRLSFE